MNPTFDVSCEILVPEYVFKRSLMDATGTIFASFVYYLKFTETEPVYSTAPVGTIYGMRVRIDPGVVPFRPIW